MKGNKKQNMSPRTLSREEEAKLAWSNKKVKDSHHSGFNDGLKVGSPPSKHQWPNSTDKVSFKDKVVGEIPEAYVEVF